MVLAHCLRSAQGSSWEVTLGPLRLTKGLHAGITGTSLQAPGAWWRPRKMWVAMAS